MDERDPLSDAFLRFLVLAAGAGALFAGAMAAYGGLGAAAIYITAPCAGAENQCSPTPWSQAAGGGVGLATLVVVGAALGSAWCALRFAISPLRLWARRFFTLIGVAVGSVIVAAVWVGFVLLVAWIAGADVINYDDPV